MIKIKFIRSKDKVEITPPLHTNDSKSQMKDTTLYYDTSNPSNAVAEYETKLYFGDYFAIFLMSTFIVLAFTNTKIKWLYNFLIIKIEYKHTPHGVDVYPQSAAGVPFTAAYIAAKGDPIANLQEDLAAEQKARATYEKLIDLCKDDPDVIDPLRFLRQREIVHFQRFGEALNGVHEKLAQKKFYMNNNNNNC